MDLSPDGIRLICTTLIISNYVFETYLDLRQYLRLKDQRQTGISPVVKKYLEQHRRKKPEDSDELKDENTTEENKEKTTTDDNETHKKTLSYNIASKKLGFITGAIDVVQELLIFRFNFLYLMWEFSSNVILSQWLGVSNAKDYEITISILVTILGYLFGLLFSVPTSLYRTFVLEEEFGFNKSTLKLWVTDLIKSTMLGAVIGLPILSLMIYIIKNYAGPHMHIYVWASLFFLSIFMIAIYPDYIATLFNKFNPLPDGELKDKIEDLARKVEFPLKGIYVMDGSTRSAHSNAYFTGFFGLKRIVLFDTIEKQMTTDEIVAILAHEIGHWRYNHITKSLVIEQIYSFLMWYMVNTFIHSPVVYQAYGFKNQRPALVGITAIMTLYSPVNQLISFSRNWLSRKHEYEADFYASSTLNKKDLAPALVAIHRENLSDMDPDPLYSTLKYSHPTLLERLRAIETATKSQ
ncbi:STE24 endopeptidase [Acrasis kona]|uniref:CAAX prenyl protease n=1 Tax=Acrasis kona TaxID=1008807 RepID=A0AAW2Z411_9EUKA